jgi:hypothetical protein
MGIIKYYYVPKNSARKDVLIYLVIDLAKMLQSIKPSVVTDSENITVIRNIV